MELAAALVGAASAIAVGIIGRTGKTRIERDVDLYERPLVTKGDAFDKAALAKLKASIEDRLCGARGRRGLAALTIEAVLYLIVIAASFRILLAIGTIDGEQARALAALLLILCLAFLIFLLAFQAAFVYREVFGVLERLDAKRRRR